MEVETFQEIFSKIKSTSIKIQRIICLNIIQIRSVKTGIQNFFHIRIVVSKNDILPFFFPEFYPNLVIISFKCFFKPTRMVQYPFIFPVITPFFSRTDINVGNHQSLTSIGFGFKRYYFLFGKSIPLVKKNILFKQ